MSATKTQGKKPKAEGSPSWEELGPWGSLKYKIRHGKGGINKKDLKAIYTLVGLGLLAIGTFLVYALFFTGKGPMPEDIKITNVTGDSATVTWVTEKPAEGIIAVSVDDDWKTFINEKVDEVLFAFDDRDVEITNDGYVLKDVGKYNTHHVTVRGLEPGRSYSYRVVYDTKPLNDIDYPELRTGADLDVDRSPLVVQGSGLNGTSTEGIRGDALVYVTVTDPITGEESNVVSTVLDENGRFSIDLSTVRSADLSRAFKNLDGLDRANVTIVGSKEVGSGSIGSIIANGNPYPPVLLMNKETLARSMSPVAKKGLVAGVSTEGSVLGADSCTTDDGRAGTWKCTVTTCPADHPAGPDEWCKCWNGGDSINYSKCVPNEDGAKDDSDKTTEDNGGVSVADGKWGGVGDYCINGDIYTCKSKDSCSKKTTCSNGCQENAPGTPDTCKESSSSGGPGAGGRSTSQGPYSSSGSEPTAGATGCSLGAKWWKSGAVHCDATNQFQVTVDGKTYTYYPQVYQEIVYQCVKDEENGGTKWISFTKPGKLTGQACTGDEVNLTSDEVKEKVKKASEDPAIEEVAKKFGSTCQASVYTYEDKASGCMMEVNQKADCSWTQRSVDDKPECNGIGVSSEDMGGGNGSGASGVDPDVATKIANMMTEAQCNELAKKYNLYDEKKGRDARIKFLENPAYKGYGYCYLTTEVSGDTCDPLDPNSCKDMTEKANKGKKDDEPKANYQCSLLATNDEVGLKVNGEVKTAYVWGCVDISGDDPANQQCNPMLSYPKNQCSEELSLCLLSSDGTAKCSTANKAFVQAIDDPKDLEEFFDVAPAGPGLEVPDDTTDLIKFRSIADGGDGSPDYFKDVGLSAKTVQQVYESSCHRYMKDANEHLCDALVDPEVYDKFELKSNINPELLGFTKKGECEDGEIERPAYMDGYVDCLTEKDIQVIKSHTMIDLYTGNELSLNIDVENWVFEDSNGVTYTCIWDQPNYVCYTDPKTDEQKDKVDEISSSNKGCNVATGFGCSDGWSCSSSSSECVEDYKVSDPPEDTFSNLTVYREQELDEAEKEVFCTMFSGDDDSKWVLDNGWFNGSKKAQMRNEEYVALREEIEKKSPEFKKLGYDEQKAVMRQILFMGTYSDALYNSNGDRDLTGYIENYCNPSKGQAAPNRSIFSSPAYAGGGGILATGSVLGASDEVPLPEDLTLPVEIVDGKLVIKDSGTYDLDYGQDIIGPDVVVEDGVENAKIAFYFDLNGNGVKDKMEPYVDADYLPLSISTETGLRTYKIEKGWNSLAIPVYVKDNLTARDIFDEFSKDDVKLSDVAVFRSGRWMVYSYDDLRGYYGTNFKVASSEGIFVNSMDEGYVAIEGKKYTSGVPMYLSTGWNLVGVVGSGKEYSGFGLLESINSRSKGAEIEATKIVGWNREASKFDVDSVKIVNGSPKEYGNESIKKVSDQEGYFIKVDKGGGVFTP